MNTSSDRRLIIVSFATTVFVVALAGTAFSGLQGQMDICNFMPQLEQCKGRVGGTTALPPPSTPPSGMFTVTSPLAGFEDDVRVNTSPAPSSSSPPACPAASANHFNDTDVISPVGCAANTLWEKNIIGGYPDGTFKAGKTVNRGEIAKFLMLASGQSIGDLKNNGRFWDIPEGEWYVRFVMKAAELGIIKGNPDGSFNPQNAVNTAEFLKMLTLTFGLEQNLPQEYTDVPKDAWYAPYAGVARQKGLFLDRSLKLEPQREMTRGEVAYAMGKILGKRSDGGVPPVTEKLPVFVGNSPSSISTVVPLQEGGAVCPIGSFTRFPVHSATGRFADIVTGPDGNLWFTQGNDKIGRMTPSGSVQEFSFHAISMPHSLAAGSDGNVWFTDQGTNKIGRITPTGEMKEFEIPTQRSTPHDIVAGPDGNLWFTERTGNKIGRITTNGVITEFAVPTAGSQPLGIAVGKDANIWFAEFMGNKIGKFNPWKIDTDPTKLVEYALTIPNSGPNYVASSEDGSIWFTGYTGKYGRIFPDGRILEHPIPGLRSAWSIITQDWKDGDSDSEMWFIDEPNNAIGRISSITDTGGGVLSTFPINDERNLRLTEIDRVYPSGITIGPDRRIWFTKKGNNGGIFRFNGCSPAAPVAPDFPVIQPISSASSLTACSTGYSCNVSYGQDGKRYELAMECGFAPGSMMKTETNGACGRSPTDGICFRCVNASSASPMSQPAVSAASPSLPATHTPLSSAAPLCTPGSLTEFPNPSVYSEPRGIIAGPDGNLWFTSLWGLQIPRQYGKIGKITKDGAITEFLLPGFTSAPAADSSPWGIANGPDGNLWFTEYGTNKIGRITPSGAITEFPLPVRDSFPRDITSGPDGHLWFTEYGGNKIGRITTGGTITEFPLPIKESRPSSIVAGPDGNLWFSASIILSYGKIGRITPSGKIDEFMLNAANSFITDITAGPDGNLWFTEGSANKIGRITPSGSIREFSVPAEYAHLWEITAGPDGNLWFTAYGGNKIGRITPNGTISGVSNVPALSIARAITPGPDGNLWITDSDNKIGRLSTCAK